MTARKIISPTTISILFLSIQLMCFAGCSALQPGPMPKTPEHLPPRVELERVPFYAQEAYQCGPAALAMALTWSGQSVTPAELKDQVYSPSRKGSLQLSMVAATRRHGRIAYEIDHPESLYSEVAAGNPLIILQNLGLSWLPVWHYAVVIGYDADEQKMILRSGTTRRKTMSYYVFGKTWERSEYWGLLVLEPGQVPATATETNYLAAVLGLEKSRQYQAAIAGYQAALSRWPDSLNARMGLGNSYYGLNDLSGAENSFRKAAELHPQSAVAYNNLAYVLYKQGRKGEALALAQKAVALGGPLQPEAEKTLQEIQSSMR
jgi:tetratricopeptide (TPR) repeat protein